MLTIFAALLFTLLARSSPVHAAPARDVQGSDDTEIRRLINAFADPDPAVREQAEQKLLEIGPPARRALIDASKSGDPRIAPAAGDILLRLPWATSQDPARVRELLAGYGTQDEDDRRRTVLQLFRVKGSDAALVRLLQEDPSDNVPWTILRMLRLDADAAIFQRLRKLDVGDGTKIIARPQTL